MKAEKIMLEEALEGESVVEDKDQPQSESEAPIESADSPEAAKESPKLDLSPEGIMEIQTQLEESHAKAVEYLDGWQRARADFANYKKRVERDRVRFHNDAVGDVAKRYLPIVDDLERALKDKLKEGDCATLADGIELIFRKMLKVLEADGITPMEAEGEIFDPNFHEAIVKTESDEHECEQVIEVLQQGYMIGDRVLRPAQVRIAA
ncbi:MAG: nucleotide exchange factor GrpE [Anaerolineales bacterium]|nr:nucleotide exchange factor GrpE [Chloroflexota bacterium]MBL6980907.1 nucleotide exchange factor GrpE [Anaerolineales bacterium]